MKGSLVIEYSDTCKRINYQFEEPLSRYKDIDYKLWITLPRGRDIDVTQIKLSLNKYLLRILNGKTYASNFPDRVEILAQAYSQDIDIFDSCEEIQIKNNKDENIDQLLSNSTHKVIINDGTHPLTLSEVEKLEKEYQGKENVYFYVEDNNKPLSLEEYRATAELIGEVADTIKSYGLSPLEAAIYAYDYARDRIYVSEDISQDSEESRDLYKSLFGDRIVCVGYARIFSAILKQLGIKSSLYSIRSDDGGHAIAIARITDEKYGIDGIYYFDPTGDRKQDISDDHFFGYRSFATTRGAALAYGHYKDETLQDLNLDTYKAVVERVQLQNAHFTSSGKYYKSICNMSKFLDGESIYEGDRDYTTGPSDLIKNTSDMLDRVELFYSLLEQELDPRVKMAAIARVRKIKYYENSSKYPYSYGVLKNISSNSQPYLSEYCYPKRMANEMLAEHREEYTKDRVGIDLIKVLKKVKTQKEK